MKHILLTGASGFLGKYINTYLKEQGCTVATMGRGAGNNYPADISKELPDFREEFDAVVHVAGLVHSTRRTKEQYGQFDLVNVQGTINLCRALEKCSFSGSLVFISSVSVYGVKSGEEITEETALNGITPYALSKIKAEKFLTIWCKENKVSLSILRPALIAGVNPSGNLGAMVYAIQKGGYFPIRGNIARRSMVMAEDVAGIIPKVFKTSGIYNLCDDQHPSISELENLIAHQVKRSLPKPVPLRLARIVALAGDLAGFQVNSEKLIQLTTTLTFSNVRAKSVLGFQPGNVVDKFKINPEIQ
jgi:GlcNAc-P-P-Und epimerase